MITKLTIGDFARRVRDLARQVEDALRSYESLSSRGVPFNHPPQDTPWGFGAELLDHDGYTIRLWDQRSMNADD